MNALQASYEFERRFFCREFPDRYNDGTAPNLIIQNYYLAQDGYAIRVRIQASNLYVNMGKQTDALELLRNYSEKFDLAILTVKGPTAGGTRYESEMIIAPEMGHELIKRGGKPIVKNRYSAWIDTDGWVIDKFSGNNSGLIIAECERMNPVTNLSIPEFCAYEVTDDSRFSNDSLVNVPYSTFADQFRQELEQTLLENPELRYSKQFGENTLIQ